MKREHVPVVYDKAEFHDETIDEYGLPESHACHHTAYFLRWLIEHDLMSDEFRAENSQPQVEGITNETVMKIYEWWDCCLVDDMLSDEGNAFAQFYFDFEKGQYLDDYITLLQGKLPSEFHIPLTEENYQKLKAVIDRRYTDWKERRTTSPGHSTRGSKRWWQFWRK